MTDDGVLEATRIRAGASALARWRARLGGASMFQRLADAIPERRQEERRVARLNWGKALDCEDRFLSECLVANRARDGARLRLARNISIPARFQLFEDDGGAIYAAQVVWRRGADIGCRLSRAPTPGKARVTRRMKSRYYAL